MKTIQQVALAAVVSVLLGSCQLLGLGPKDSGGNGVTSITIETVGQLKSGIGTISGGTWTLPNPASGQYQVQFTASGASGPVTWTINTDGSITSVNQDGIVKVTMYDTGAGDNSGWVTITATAGGHTASLHIDTNGYNPPAPQ